MTPEIEELLAAAEAIPTSTMVDIKWVYRLHRAARAVRQNNGDPIETGREAAIGQWEARWEALRRTGQWFVDRIGHSHMVTIGSVMTEMDQIEAEIPTGLAVGERWIPRMTGRVNLQLEPERVTALFRVMHYALRQAHTGDVAHVAPGLIEDLTLQAERQGWER